jgi:hypothetical protein
MLVDPTDRHHDGKDEDEKVEALSLTVNDDPNAGGNYSFQ